MYAQPIRRLFADRSRKAVATIAAAALGAIGAGIGALIWTTTKDTATRVVGSSGAPIDVRVAAPGTFFASHPYAPYFVVPRSRFASPSDVAGADELARIARSDGFSSAAWAARTEAIAGSPQIVRLHLRGKVDEPVTVTAIRPIVVRRGPALIGWYIATPACGVDLVHLADIDLDRPGAPVRYFRDDAHPESNSLTLFVTRTDSEQIELQAHTRDAMVDWRAEVFYAGAEKDGSVVIDDGGRPFRVTSERSSDGYTTKFDDAGRVQVAREHGWDDGISAC